MMLNPVGLGLTNAELLGDGALSAAGSKGGSDFNNLLSSEFGGWVMFAGHMERNAASVLCSHVSKVLRLSSDAQMRWIATWRVVAGVKDF